MKQAVADGKALNQFLKSFLNDTTVGFAEYLCQFDKDNEIAPNAAAVTIATQNKLMSGERLETLTNVPVIPRTYRSVMCNLGAPKNGTP